MIYPAIISASEGSDWTYAGWYAELLGSVEKNFFPVFYADYLAIEDAGVPFVTDHPTERTPRLALPPPPDQ